MNENTIVYKNLSSIRRLSVRVYCLFVFYLDNVCLCFTWTIFVCVLPGQSCLLFTWTLFVCFLPGQCLFVFYLDNVSFCLPSTGGKTNNITVQNFHGLRGESKESNVR